MASAPQDLPTPKRYQTPPVLETEISGAERAAGSGSALSFAKRISATAATVAGALGGGLFTLASLNGGATQRGLKSVFGAAAGALAGFFISQMPWVRTQPRMPHTPHMPRDEATHTVSDQPSATQQHEAPAMAVAEPEHAGTVTASTARTLQA